MITIEYARTHKIPFLGICLGMQLAIIEFARHLGHLPHATSEEFADTGDFVIHYMKEQQKDGPKGGNMRLGAYPCQLVAGSMAHKVYGSLDISERHRHRLEVNNHFLAPLKKAGLVVSGVYEKQGLVELIELKDHPYFMACQFHPEFKSRPVAPHPLFKSFVEASLKHAPIALKTDSAKKENKNHSMHSTKEKKEKKHSRIEV